MKERLLFLFACILSTALCLGQEAKSTPVPPMVFAPPMTFSLKGKASGGTLLVAEGLNPSPYWVAIETLPGEPAMSVAEKVAKALTEKYRSMGDNALFTAEDGIVTSNLRMPIILAGSETGLGIPPPPTGLTGFANDGERYILSWEPPSGNAYDAVHITVPRFYGPDTVRRPGNTTTIEWIHTKESALRAEAGTPGLPYFVVWGSRDGVPSAAVGIRIAGNKMEESLAFPFVKGVMPNWVGWKNARGSEIGARQSRMSSLQIHPYYTDPVGKPLHQVLSPSPSGRSGIARPILGIGDAKEIAFGLQLLPPADAADKTWSLEFHAVPLPIADVVGDDGVLKIALPAKAKVGRVDNTSAVAEKQWAKMGPSSEGSSIAFSKVEVPEGVDSYTFVVELMGPEGLEVGLDWFTVEVLSKR